MNAIVELGGYKVGGGCTADAFASPGSPFDQDSIGFSWNYEQCRLERLLMAFIAKLGDQTYTVEIEETGKSVYRVSVDGNEFLVDGKKTGRTNYSLIVDNRSFEIEVDSTDDEYRVLVDGRTYHIELVDERRLRVGGAQAGLELQGRQKVTVPMPGKVIAVLVSEGDTVEKGQGLIIVEAMKMENEVRSPIAGEVKEIKVKAGETVEGGALLVVVE